MAWAGAAEAQQGASALTGTVFDSSNRKPLADVIVMVTSPALQEAQYTTTDASGFYRVPGLPVGTYKIRYELQGYFPYEQDGIALRADVTFRLNPSLSVAQGEATEVVVKVRPTVDVGSSTTSTSMNSEFLKRVPVSAPGSKGAASRSFESVASVAPGTATDGYGTGINGASSPENHYSVDGLSVGNPGKGTVGTQLSTEFVEEVNVVAAGYMPEFGRSTGGVLNVVTKQGSNEFHGGVFSYFSPGTLEGKRKVVGGEDDSGYNPVTYDPKLSYIGDVGFDLGGPIVKDKLWFYVGGDISNTRYNITRAYNMEVNGKGQQLFAENYVADSRMYQGMAKLTYSPNADNRITVAAYGTPVFSGGGGSFNSMTGTVTPGKYAIDPAAGTPEVGGGSVGTYGSQAHQFVSTPIDLSAKWSSQFMQKKLLLDVMLGTHLQTDSRRAADGSTAADFNPGSLGSYYNVNYRRRSDATVGDQMGYHNLNELEVPGLGQVRWHGRRQPLPGGELRRRLAPRPQRRQVQPLPRVDDRQLPGQRPGPPPVQGRLRRRAHRLQEHQEQPRLHRERGRDPVQRRGALRHPHRPRRLQVHRSSEQEHQVAGGRRLHPGQLEHRRQVHRQPRCPVRRPVLLQHRRPGGPVAAEPVVAPPGSHLRPHPERQVEGVLQLRPLLRERAARLRRRRALG